MVAPSRPIGAGDGQPLPPALLADSTWYGTLAAVRDLGSRGVPITLACDSGFAPARWSRYVTSVVRWPRTKDHGQFLRRLHEFGDRQPGHVLYPTSDDAAWLIAREQEALASKYRLYSPALQALVTLLDKGKLAQAAQAAGMLVPAVWLPEDEADVERIAREVPFPLFVKPRTQLMPTLGFKGCRVDRCEDLVPIWRALRVPEQRLGILGASMPGVGCPLVMGCYPASESIFTVDGFVDRSGDMVALGCNKILQLPRRVGPGVIFEDASPPPFVLSGLQRLFCQARYFGVYDAEFIMDGDRPILIDVNPRFYNHMTFEIDRGLPLPWLAYLGALGNDAALTAAMRAAREEPKMPGRTYLHRLPTTLLLAGQGLAGAMPREERRRWRAWIAEHSGQSSDPSTAPGDRMPGIADWAYHGVQFLRHPRSFIRDLVRADATVRHPPPTGKARAG